MLPTYESPCGLTQAAAYSHLANVLSGAQIACANDGITVMTKSIGYDAWNRLTNTVTVDAGLEPLDSHRYTNNLLNQITSRDVPGYANSLGTANRNATVTLWSDTGLFAPTLRKGDYFSGELPINNTTGAVWLTLTNVAVLRDGGNPDIVTNTVGNVLLAKTPETFGYDADGNLTNDGRWALTWDGENRLVAMTSLTTTPAGSKQKAEFAYDHQSRRIQKIVSSWNGSSYVAQSTNRFVYDGWNLIAILNPQSSILQSFVWGLDLSGTEQGAGGVGGLLLTRNAELGTQNFVAYDGNGNVTALVNSTNGAISSQYEYGPFGELLRATGPMARANPFRFSTKYQDDETDLLYYGYRSYNPSVGRWLSRDPIAERGGKNLYGFVGNDPVSRFDRLGLFGNPPSGPNGPNGPVVSWTCKRTCGPDYTAAINAEIAKLRAYLAGLPPFPTPDPGIEWPPSPGNERDHANVRSFYQWFANVASSLNYDTQAKEQAGKGDFVGDGCPSAACTGTVTLCGKCVGSDTAGIVMYGFLAAGSGVSDSVRNRLAQAQEMRDKDGEFFEEDTDVFPAGKDLFNSGSNDICTIMNKLPAHTKSSCNPCNTTGSFKDPKDWGKTTPYPVYR